MQRIRILIFLGLVLCLIFASGALAASSENYRIDWMAPLSGAGGGQASSAHYAVNYTIGQSVVGAASSASYSGTLGYWYRQVSDWLVRLPQLFRRSP